MAFKIKTLFVFVLVVIFFTACDTEPETPDASGAGAGDYEFVKTWGRTGRNNSEFKMLVNIHADKNSNLYATDTTGRLQIFSTEGVFKTQWEVDVYFIDGKKYSSPGYGAITSDIQGNIYFTEYNLANVKKFSSAGQLLTEWKIPSVGSKGAQPNAIAVDSRNNVYVSDFSNNRILKYSSTGVLKKTFPYSGFGLAIDKTDHMLVSGMSSITKIDSLGNVVKEWRTYGHNNNDNTFDYPHGIAVDSKNNIYIADTGNSRIKKYDSSGNFITKWGSYGTANGQFYGVESITVDSKDYVYTSETYNARIQVFKSK